MRYWVALLLQRLANSIYDSECYESVVVVDEFGICRCRVDITGDDIHGVDATFSELPSGWELHTDDTERPIKTSGHKPPEGKESS